MTKTFWASLLMTSALSVQAYAADFIARLDRNAIAMGDSVTLQLSVSGTETKGGPDLSPLKEDFAIMSQGQSTSVQIINGHTTSSTGWEITITPKKQGTLTIPPIAINTSDGALHTKPLTLAVDQAAADNAVAAGHAKSHNVTIQSDVSTTTPYKDQVINYYAKIIAHGELANLALDDLTVDNAVIEKEGKPVITDAVEDGEPVKIITLHYLITPLAAGKITIPALTMQGEALDERSQRMEDPFGGFGGDPFAMMRHLNAMGFGQMKPFSASGNSLQLNVKPAAVAMEPWLPLTSLTLNEEWDNNQIARVGEPLTRKLTLMAEGTSGKQLPSLEAQQNTAHLKVYADKPITNEKVAGNSITGTRTESYSLVPQEPGKLVLPEIKVAWWNIAAEHIEYAVLPARTLDVQPALPGTQPAPIPQTNAAASAEPKQALPASSPATQPALQGTAAPTQDTLGNPLVVIVIGGLLAALVAAVLWVINLQRKVRGLITKQNQTSQVNTLPEITRSVPSMIHSTKLADVATPQQLVHFMRDYARENYGVAENAPLETVFSTLATNSKLDKKVISTLAQALSASLYAGQDVDLEKLKESCAHLITSLKQPENDNARLPEKLPKLNPS